MRRSRKLSEKAVERIAPIAVLPLFHRLQDRPVLVVGGSEAVAWKLELLLATGAVPTLVAERPVAEVRALIMQHALLRSEFDAVLARLSEFALVVADVEAETQARALFDAAVARGVPINQIDRPAFCTVQFGSIVNRSPVVVGISTDGTAPVLGQAIRQKVERLLPRNLGAWGMWARAMRATVRTALPLPSLRRAWWTRFADTAMSGAELPAVANDAMPVFGGESGRVTLVGAGPGDPDLLTVKAIRALQDADVVLFDALVSDDILELARREAQRMPVGKRGGRPSCKQEEINRLMIRFAGEGKHVVRLKAGDPAIFSRGGEEVRALRDAGIDVSIVPGITTASAAAASIGKTLTDRHFGRQLLYVSGHGRGDGPAEIDWQAVASERTTIALYMGRGRLAAFSAEAMARGACASTPVSVGVSISRPDEAWVHSTLAEAATSIGELDQEQPSLVLMGEVLRQDTCRELRRVDPVAKAV
ncbi:MAG: siroheme synthase CysG [Minwuia sp.]|nr:siroheme synthase CysG [Minwuia sp.]